MQYLFLRIYYSNEYKYSFVISLFCSSLSLFAVLLIAFYRCFLSLLVYRCYFFIAVLASFFCHCAR